MTERPSRIISSAVAAGVVLTTAVTSVLLITGASWTRAGGAALVATLLLVWSAGLARRADPFAALLDAVAAFAFDAVVLASLAWALRFDDPMAAAAALIALIASVLSAYVVAKGRALGYPVRGGSIERTIRGGLVTAAIFLGGLALLLWATVAVAVVVGVVNATKVPQRKVTS